MKKSLMLASFVASSLVLFGCQLKETQDNNIKRENIAEINNKISKISIDEWFEAVNSNNLEKVREFVEKGIDVNAQNKNGLTALSFAVYFRHEKIAKYLMEHGADVDKVNKKGMLKTRMG